MKKATGRKWPLSKISTLHYLKLAFRSCLFLAAAVIYVVNRIIGSEDVFGGYEHRPVILIIIWLVFAVEMALRFFPSRLESMGCQKQFARNYAPNPEGEGIPRTSGRQVLLIAALWLALNGAIGALYLTGIIDYGILMLISLAFSVCDMVCILFFCPFQQWFMKNKCCGSCRIYNWDYAMMFTPLLFVGGAYYWSLLGIALALLIKWEIECYLHPERFFEATNGSLSCANCQVKLCRHKKSLQKFLQEQWTHLKKGQVLPKIRRKKRE